MRKTWQNHRLGFKSFSMILRTCNVTQTKYMERRRKTKALHILHLTMQSNPASYSTEEGVLKRVIFLAKFKQIFFLLDLKANEVMYSS